CPHATKATRAGSSTMSASRIGFRRSSTITRCSGRLKALQRSSLSLTQSSTPSATVSMYWKTTLLGAGALGMPSSGGTYGMPNSISRYAITRIATACPKGCLGQSLTGAPPLAAWVHAAAAAPTGAARPSVAGGQVRHDGLELRRRELLAVRRGHHAHHPLEAGRGVGVRVQDRRADLRRVQARADAVEARAQRRARAVEGVAAEAELLLEQRARLGGRAPGARGPRPRLHRHPGGGLPSVPRGVDVVRGDGDRPALRLQVRD